MSAETWQITAGKPYPMGASLHGEGANFALASAHAEKVELCLFDGGRETRLVLPTRVGTVFCGFVAGVRAGQRYGFRVHGGNGRGLCFNPQKLLIDSYSTAIDGRPDYRDEAQLQRYHFSDGTDNADIAPKSVVAAEEAFDWQNDRHPDTPWVQTVIYEAHVKGLTRLFPDLQHAGTYRALADERVIAYLRGLGVSAVELLPVQQHLDEYHLQRMGLSNYWGYNTYSHFAAEPGYASEPQAAAQELKQAVRALHQAGIEVIMDVVYNHTAEQDASGPMLCQRGIDNKMWYWQRDEGGYENWSGCGNTLNVADREVSRWVLDSLRYWVTHFHIDGFRFDLGTILGRQPDFCPDAHFFHALYQDPVLTGRKLIAEAWDIGSDGYHLGGFPLPFSEWNGRFRDDMRAFWLWESGDLGLFAKRLSVSADLFRHSGRLPSAGVNFITAHDGFTLNDLVSYNDKHNHANGEHNRDGHDENISYNHGIEGETDDAAVLSAREYSAKALLASLFLSAGTPMLTAGDEFGNSQQGNNNSYCQDNETAWLKWPSRPHVLQQYARDLINVRRQIPLLNQDAWWSDKAVAWLDSDGLPMTEAGWHNLDSKAMQILMNDEWLLLVNAKRGLQHFHLPAGQWRAVCSPSEKPNEPLLQECVCGHMGIWILRRGSEAQQTV